MTQRQHGHYSMLQNPSSPSFPISPTTLIRREPNCAPHGLSLFLFNALRAPLSYPPFVLPFQFRRIPTVVRKGPAVLKLLSGEDQTLLVRGDTLLVLDLGLDIVDSVGGLDLKGDGLSGKTANNPLEQRLQ